MPTTIAPARGPLRAALLAGFLLLFPLFSCGAFAAPGAVISEYRVLSEPCVDRAGKPLLAIRSFRRAGVPFLLTVDPYTMESAARPVAEVTLQPGESARLAGTPYLKALERETAPPYRLQNHGARHGEGEGAFYLTADLCPSRRPFERRLFEAAAALPQGGRVPVAVAVTGVWLKSHPDELAYLREKVAEGRLAVTWVNHSFHHVYDPKAALEKNFLLTPGTDFDSEVLDLEQLLLSEGLTPSPFFRFPGLVADGATVQRLRELSLIPVGSDAWLAKGEHVKGGSFVLVHGNGNEPKGVDLALPILASGKWRLLPLAAAFRR